MVYSAPGHGARRPDGKETADHGPGKGERNHELL